MSRGSEKALKEINKYLEQHVTEDMSNEEVNDLIQKFIAEYNSMPHKLTEENAETSDDYYELAENAKTKAQALKFAERALQLDADNIDAKVMIEELSTKHPYEMIEKYQRLIEYGKEVMTKKGYMDKHAIGNYWGITETRPFIRLCSSYFNLLIECGMKRMAADVGEMIIRYNQNDNLGIRYQLMHIYAFLEDEKSMLKLHKKYDAHDESQMLLPLSILYYKLVKLDKAEEYLKRLEKANKDTGKFVRAILNNSFDKYISQMNDMGYQPFTIEEFIVELQENMYLFETTLSYFEWAAQVLKKKKTK